MAHRGAVAAQWAATIEDEERQRRNAQQQPELEPNKSQPEPEPEAEPKTPAAPAPPKRPRSALPARYETAPSRLFVGWNAGAGLGKPLTDKELDDLLKRVTRGRDVVRTLTALQGARVQLSRERNRSRAPAVGRVWQAMADLVTTSPGIRVPVFEGRAEWSEAEHGLSHEDTLNAWQAVGDAAEEDGELDIAMRTWKKMLCVQQPTALPRDVASHMPISHAMMGLGRSHLRRKDGEAALALFRHNLSDWERRLTAWEQKSPRKSAVDGGSATEGERSREGVGTAAAALADALSMLRAKPDEEVAALRERAASFASSSAHRLYLGTRASVTASTGDLSTSNLFAVSGPTSTESSFTGQLWPSAPARETAEEDSLLQAAEESGTARQVSMLRRQLRDRRESKDRAAREARELGLKSPK